MSVTPAAAFGLKANDPGVLALRRFLFVKQPMWDTRAQPYRGWPSGCRYLRPSRKQYVI
jgi:hypothetical protein